ncbi:MAG: hypothetical protein JO010_05590, partial [Alphaproteobacteria bacterium]|nr:hypothetical protein [Alphaproteobacteria bacterium]
MARRWRLLSWACGGVLALLLLLFASALVVLKVPAGQRWAAALASRILSTPGDTIGLERIGLAFPDALILEGIALGDRQGRWLAIDKLVVTPHLRRLLAGSFLALRQVEIGHAELIRLPESNGASSGPAKPLRIDLLSVERLDLDRPVLGEPAVFEIAGSGLAREAARFSGRLSLTRTDAPGAASLAGRYDPEAGPIEVHASIDEPTGVLLARLAGRRLPLAARLDGTGSLADWRGSLGVESGDASRLAAVLTLAAR